MTGDEAVPADFDANLESIHRGALTAVEENAGPIHHADEHDFAAKMA